ncbi:ribosome maturation factor RimM [Desulfobotulus sp. H1]|uniref:Ribosome maturation factor RimM n=1 Tax=Desulfobotulus pelophilus TaxID=2823377 RepID=A0ABT3NAN7_9BACT|nr:ribosome maturation factor RimM [Desulfobotulus pelophilus]MCW7754529.1 ribosome maturation factor RimM [Desulfobotulus pelophilus]
MKLVRIGKIVGTHGLAGNLKVYSDAASLSVYTDCGPLHIREKQGVEPNRPFRAKQVHVHKGPVLLLRFEGIESHEAAQSLVGGVICADRDRFPEPEEGSYYWSDLIGLEVRTHEGEVLGHIRGIMETGSYDLLDVAGKGREYLVPANPDWICSVLPEDGYLVVRLPEGFLDL